MFACFVCFITQVVPNTAGTNGGIIVTVFGKELGSAYSDVTNITLAGVQCIPKPQDFEPSTQ